MPFTPKKLSARVERADFTLGGEPGFVEYRPAVLSGDGLQQLHAIQERIKAATTEEDGQAATNDFAVWFVRLIAAWDYQEDSDKDGKPGPMVPLTVERVKQELERYGDFVGACASAATAHFTSGKSIGVASSAQSGATS